MPARKYTLLAFLFLGLSFLLPLPNALAQGIIATLESPTIVRLTDAATGQQRGRINISPAVEVGCDGVTVAVLSKNGMINRYDAKTSRSMGSIQPGGNAKNLQVTGGIIVIQSGNLLKRFDARTGQYKGSTNL